jgi:exodeoxyribonuclease VII small subunit
MADVAEISKLTYEQALAELETLIKRLETGSIDLADSIATYERGAALAAHCGRLLAQTEQKVDRLVLDQDGEVGEQPFQAGEGSTGVPANPDLRGGNPDSRGGK